MPSPLHADRPAPRPVDRGTLDALITQARRLRGDLDAVRPVPAPDDEGGADDASTRWQRALCDLAAHQLDDLGGHLDQLRQGTPAGPLAAPPADTGATADGSTAWGATARGATARGAPAAPDPSAEPAGEHPRVLRADGTTAAAYGPAPGPVRLSARVGSAEWNLLTDEVSWSEELYTIFGRSPEDGPLSLDELPSWVTPDDQMALAGAVTDCLVDGRPVNQEFRIARPDGAERTVHMTGEPLLDDEGGTASMWAVLRDVSELRRSQRAVRRTRDTVERERQRAQTEHRVAVELQETVLPSWSGSSPLSGAAGAETGTLDLAAHYLPSTTSPLIGGDWYDALELPDGGTLLSAGDLTGHGVAATSGMTMLLGAVRGMAVAGVEPGTLMGHLNQMLDSSAQPALSSALCCRYNPGPRTLTWAQAGHPAPLLFRGGTGRALRPPEGVLLGVTTGAAYGRHTEQLEPGDILILHTDGLAPRDTGAAQPGQRERAGGEPESGAARLLQLAPRFTAAGTAQECVRIVVEQFADGQREDDACVLIARVPH